MFTINLHDDCENCPDKHGSFAHCMNICTYPGEILQEYSNERTEDAKYEEELQKLRNEGVPGETKFSLGDKVKYTRGEDPEEIHEITAKSGRGFGYALDGENHLFVLEYLLLPANDN